jgi:hypothetical protein
MTHTNKSEERVDLVDVKGRIREKSVFRSQAQTYPNLHLQIVIVVVFDKLGRMLVQKRAHTKKINPGDIDHPDELRAGQRSGALSFVDEFFEDTELALSGLKKAS